MKSFFNGLLLGIILGAAGYWFIQHKAREHPEAEQRAEAAAAQAPILRRRCGATFVGCVEGQTGNARPSLRPNQGRTGAER